MLKLTLSSPVPFFIVAVLIDDASHIAPGLVFAVGCEDASWVRQWGNETLRCVIGCENRRTLGAESENDGCRMGETLGGVIGCRNYLTLTLIDMVQKEIVLDQSTCSGLFLNG